MRRFLLIVFFLLLAFYVAWPAFSLWQMYSSVHAGDADMLKKKVDFAGVRASMGPAVEAKITAHVEKMKRDDSAAAAVLGSVVTKSMLRDSTTVVLDHLVTAENIIRMSREPGTLSEKIDRVVSRALGLPGGAGAQGAGQPGTQGVAKQAVATPASDNSPAENSPPDFGFANIRGFRVINPLAFEIDVAKDAASPTADATARISFQQFDWKLTGVVPRIE